MVWEVVGLAVLLLGLVLAFFGVDLLAMGVQSGAPVVLLIASLYVVTVGVATLLVAVALGMRRRPGGKG